MESTPFFPTPNGVRDMLPTELREMTSLLAPIRSEIESHEFEEIHTPALEYESVMAVGDLESTAPAFRFLDDEGRTLVLRSDMTVPTARLVATRLSDQPPPFRLYYVAHIYRGRTVPGQAREAMLGQAREFLQLGAELIGRSGLAAALELLEVLVSVLDSAGLSTYNVVLGDASLHGRLMAALEIPPPQRDRLQEALAGRDFVELSRSLDSLLERHEVPRESVELLRELAQTRGGTDVFERLDDVVADSADTLRRIAAEVNEPVQKRLVFDFGMTRQHSYYSGEMFEIHHPALGQPIGGGGRYDGLLAEFGRPLEAIGFGVSVEALHAAKLAEDAKRKPQLESTE